jgi:glycosyltransferase involved in cell wall biosynthesis
MRILVCSTGFLPADAAGGVPYSTFNLCKALVRAGADVRVLTTDRNGIQRLDVPTDCWTAHEGIPVWYAKTAPGPFLFARSAGAAVAEVVPSVDCVINSGTLWVHLGFLAWRAARRHGKPSITYLRGLLDPWAMDFKPVRKRTYWYLCGKRILDDSAAVVALHEQERERIRALGITTRIEVIPNGAAIPGDTDSLGRDLIDTRFPALSGRRYVLFLGRVHQKKGMDVLIPAISEMLAAGQAAAFVIAGPIESGYAAVFSELVRANALDGRIILTGTVGGNLKTALLRHADLFVLPAYSEGQPVAVLEALLCGCPVIITRQCNVPEVEEAKAGLIIDPDRRQLVEAMRLILQSGDLRRAMADRARTLAKEKFDWDPIGERTLALCRALASARAPFDPAVTSTQVH